MAFLKLTGDIHFTKLQNNDGEFKIENKGNSIINEQKLSFYKVGNENNDLGLHVYGTKVSINGDLEVIGNILSIQNGVSVDNSLIIASLDNKTKDISISADDNLEFNKMITLNEGITFPSGKLLRFNTDNPESLSSHFVIFESGGILNISHNDDNPIIQFDNEKITTDKLIANGNVILNDNIEIINEIQLKANKTDNTNIIKITCDIYEYKF